MIPLSGLVSPFRGQCSLRNFSSFPELGRSIIFDPPYDPNPPGGLRAWRREEFARQQKESKEKIEKRKDPWSVLVNTPKRQCILTRQILPCGFMINLRPTIHPNHQTNLNPPLILLPDRIQHPKILPRKKGKGVWVTCHYESLGRLLIPGPHLGILQSFHSLSIPTSLPRIVSHQLQLRIQQEFSILIRRLRARPKDERGLIHRLDVSSSFISDSSSPLPEFHSGESSSIFESTGDSMTQSSDDPVEDRLGNKIDNFLEEVNIPRDTIALFIFHPQTSSNIHTNQRNEDPSIPVDDARWGDTFIRSDGTQIPIYHLDLFPLENNPLQELHTLSLFSQSGSTEVGEKATSQVWALDTSAPWGHLGVPLVMALWRLRMYHGYEWEQVS
ncbi:hypothetical protein TREMEDRAFT_74262 [Tremella mesenterica DSM 1558]|uniref:uncharacterized protein n=1 Tax=Tremella mesenterica (strain ATCC 24925 / CBS 8224 / DSM 1558 / NBRC 9311 / NRRL Y-6157 / RJB 2259-6 / UBC 559-6) TaxID=578456 RepID=UPI0003F49C50|nr:uncharacterized protein TREMEDRAFT_74262 [Tremella mesenterica DSM 1558]EIW68381.1 hypothetical protein TREMEDRAFT_74262 [Tremella mesenterica DSM 1558]